MGHSAHVFTVSSTACSSTSATSSTTTPRDPVLRNELGLLWLLTFDGLVPTRVQAIPLALGYCHTRLADRDEAAWIANRFRRACAAVGTDVEERAGRLVVEWARGDEPQPARDISESAPHSR